MKKLLFTAIIAVICVSAFGQLDIVKRDLTATRQITIRDTSLLNFVKKHGGSITLTTIGTSGAATLINGVLNIPQYSGGGGEFPYTKTFANDSVLYWVGNEFNLIGTIITQSIIANGEHELSTTNSYLNMTNSQTEFVVDDINGGAGLGLWVDSAKFFANDPIDGRIDLMVKTKSIEIRRNSELKSKIDENGYLRGLVPHAHMQFMDSTVTIALTQNTWYQITRQSSRNTWPDSELVGFTSNGDSLICPVSGHYNITCKVNITGVASKDYEYRIMKKTATSGSTPTEVWRYQVSGTGTRVLRDISSYINLNATDRCWIELRSITSSPGSVTLHGGEFLINPVHLFLN